MIESRWQLWLLCWGAAALLLGVLYLIQRRTRDATAVDAGWAGSLVLIAGLVAILGPGELEHRLLILVLAGLENLRIASLVRGRLGKGEDTRYQELRRRWRERGREQVSFAIFYQAQAFVAAAPRDPLRPDRVQPQRRPLPARVGRRGALAHRRPAGGARRSAAEALQGRAGEQGPDDALRPLALLPPPELLLPVAHLGRVRADRPRGPVGVDRVVAPAFILYLILFVTGVKPAEEQALKSRGDDFRRYQRETSVFIPWRPRSSTA